MEQERKIEFKAGYHEWLVLVNDEVVYAFDFDGEDFDLYNGDLEIISNVIIDTMKEQFELFDDGEEIDSIKKNPHFTNEELKILKDLIYDTYSQIYYEQY